MKINQKITTIALSVTLLVSSTAAYAVGRSVTNGDFETGTAGDTSISGWTSTLERIDLGVTSIAGCTTVDTSDYTTLRD